MKKGVTLLETIVSMVVIVIISIMITQTVIQAKDSETIITRVFVSANEVENQHAIMQYSADNSSTENEFVSAYVSVLTEMYKQNTDQFYYCTHTPLTFDLNIFYDNLFNATTNDNASYYLSIRVVFSDDNGTTVATQSCTLKDMETNTTLYTYEDYEVHL